MTRNGTPSPVGEDLIPLVPIAKLQQGRPGGLRSKAMIETALGELEDASRAQLVRDGKRKMIAVNPPLVIEGGAW